ncbi:hypothetical protein K490DRAFT_61151 [Saccharata proteae CBS 121410]|uniref:Uncharacterized protein n=1 Tax=Saccharata proteae CBS 121410 TaxID=1314787 RepID=A0A9P4M204_9PEZI|nr:hypothetical protein K490DRAFT_61151 [Saccharata proteae CBS 121410]
MLLAPTDNIIVAHVNLAYGKAEQRGLAYNTRAAKKEPSNVALLQTCQLINREATGIFYSANQIVLYDEDNIEIFFWLLDIGSSDRSAIRDLSIDWAYGVEVSAGMLHVRSLLKEIISLQDSESADVERQRVQLIGAVRCLELKQVKLIVRTLNLLVSSQKLESLAVTLPGVDAGDMFDIDNDNVFFAEELFSNSTRNVHACVPALLEKFVGLRKLTIGYTKDLDLAQKVANSVGAEELVVQLAPESRWYGVDDLDRAAWISKGWTIEDREARKHFAKPAKSTEVSREKDRSANRTKNKEASKEQSRKEHRIDGYEDSSIHSYRADMPVINREIPEK